MGRARIRHTVDLTLPRLGERHARGLPVLATCHCHPGEKLASESVLFEETVQGRPEDQARWIARTRDISPIVRSHVVEREPFLPTLQRPGAAVADLVAAHKGA